MSTQKQEGYTDLPNFICDEGYLAALSGEAIKCLIFLNRHINGFHLEQKSMGEALVMKVTGIRDNRTIRKYMAELAKYQLVSIYKVTGKSNVYSLTFENRLPIKPVTPHVSGQEQPVTSHVTGQNSKPVTCHVAASDIPGTCHATAPVTSHATTTSDMPCHSVKEIYLKENSKININDEPCEKTFIAQNRSMLQFIEYYPQDSRRYSINELVNNYPIADDFTKQAVASFPNLSSEQIHGLLKELGQWALKNETVQTPQSWISTWLTFLKNHQSKVQEKAGKTTTAAKPKTGGRRDFMAAAQRMSEKN